MTNIIKGKPYDLEMANYVGIGAVEGFSRYEGGFICPKGNFVQNKPK